MSILSETIISGDSTDIYQVFYILLVAGKIDDARKFFQVIVKKFAEQQNSHNLKKICSKFQKLDQILIQLNVILSDPNSFRQRMEQFQTNVVAPLYEKMKEEADKNLKEENETDQFLLEFPVHALAFISGVKDEVEVRRELFLVGDKFLAGWLFALVAELVYLKPDSDVSMMGKLAHLNMEETYPDNAFPISFMTKIVQKSIKFLFFLSKIFMLEVLTMHLLMYDIIPFVDRFCESNDNILPALILIDLLYHADISLPDCPQGDDFFQKRRLVAEEFTSSIVYQSATFTKYFFKKMKILFSVQNIFTKIFLSRQLTI